jgi:hypothetical protein
MGTSFEDRICPICGRKFEDAGFAYFSAGADHARENGDSVVGKQRAKLVSSWNFGYHYPSFEHYGALVSMDIVNRYPCDNFGFYFCSIGCIRKWLNAILDDVEEHLQNEHMRLAAEFSAMD